MAVVSSEAVKRWARVLPKLVAGRLDPDCVHGPDPETVESIAPLVRALRRYFRAEVHGLERVPAGKALLVGNHNAGITFFEPFMLALAWLERGDNAEPIHFLGHDAMVKMPVVGNLLLKCGAIRADHACAGKAFAMGHKVGVFPGGNYEAFRPYKERHKVDFGGKTGFVRLALQHQVPIVPVMCLGGHSTFFVLWRGEPLAKLLRLDRLVRSKACPLFLALPWGLGFGPIFHLPLPAKLVVEVGEPITLAAYGPEAADDKETVQALAKEVEARIQEMMDRRVKRG